MQGGILELHHMDKDGNTQVPVTDCPNEATEVDFKLKNNVILIRGELNDQKVNFCFDTGAEITIISNTLDDRAYESISITGSMPLMGSSGKAVYVLQGNLPELNLGVPVRNCRVVISDLSRMSDAFGVKVDGMIGFDMIARGSLVINFKKRTLTFCPIS